MEYDNRLELDFISINRGKGLQERFDNSYIPVTETGCWLWLATVDTHGYGMIYAYDRQQLAHRVSYMLHREGDISNSLVCHVCDTPSCVNPNHLFLGTKKDNYNDMVSKGRKVILSKRRNGLAIKLSNAEISAIEKDSRTYIEIAGAYGIGKSTVGNIKTGNHWSAYR